MPRSQFFKSAGGHGIRFQTVPNKAMESDGKQGLITLVYLQRSLLHLLIASDDGSRLSRNPLQVLLLCVGKTAIMYAKTVQREDCTSVLLDGFRLSCRLW